MRLVICLDCNGERPYYAKGRCRQCYQRDYKSRYNVEHREERQAYNRQWHERNPGAQAIFNRRWHARHPNYNQRWEKQNPEKSAARNRREQARRRARMAKVASTLTPQQAEFERRIGEATYPDEKLHMHHLVPISKGGGHTWGNITFIPASLNHGLGNRLPEAAYEQASFS